MARTNYPKGQLKDILFFIFWCQKQLEKRSFGKQQGISPVFNRFAGTKPKLTNLILFLQYLLYYMFCWQKVLFIIMRAASDTIIAAFQEGAYNMCMWEREKSWVLISKATFRKVLVYMVVVSICIIWKSSILKYQKYWHMGKAMPYVVCKKPDPLLFQT